MRIIILMASLRGFEPPTSRLGGERSILLSYKDKLNYFNINLLKMKDSKKFWVMIGLLVLLAVVGPGILTLLFVASSSVFSPMVFIVLIVAAAAVLAYKGGIGR